VVLILGADCKTVRLNLQIVSHINPSDIMSDIQPVIEERPFLHAPERLKELSEGLLAQALRKGASDVAVRVSEASVRNLTVRHGKVETRKSTRQQHMTITVYDGLRRAHASSTDFSFEALVAAVDAAWHMVRFTQRDPYSGLADSAWLEVAPRDLDLFHPLHDNSGKSSFELCRRVEEAACSRGPLITNNVEVNLSSSNGQFAFVTSRGFEGGYPSSMYAIRCSAVARDASGMQSGAWNSVRRQLACLDTPESIGQQAADRASSMLGARRIATGALPVLFEAPVAGQLIAALVSAVSGGAQYRRSSFLLDSLGCDVLTEHLSLHEDPHELQGIASNPFDGDGVCTHVRDVVTRGMLNGYFLSTYDARKLGKVPTGHSHGAHNLRLTSTRTTDQDNLSSMIGKMYRGLFVTNLIGDGINLVTGDYSVGASGFWVDHGQIQYPVHEITIAGNLKEMLLNIVALGSDTHHSRISTGSLLIERMQIAGV
jgi:PmbA protein